MQKYKHCILLFGHCGEEDISVSTLVPQLWWIVRQECLKFDEWKPCFPWAILKTSSRREYIEMLFTASLMNELSIDMFLP